ncbi:MAG: RluA family pseudouridine synthase [Pirellulaceae bacterium]|nr:RluA family pseudouridine synthase [Pirellulaceae bacterium]
MARATITEFTARSLAKPTRLDRVLRDHFPLWGRQAVQRLITAGKVQLNGRVVWLASWEVQNGERLQIADPPASKTPPPDTFDDAWVIAEEEDLIAINKPAGLLSEPKRFSQTPNLLELASARFGSIVLFHRLDRDTSGIVLLTRAGKINKYLDTAFKSHTILKEYLAVVATPNRLGPEGVIDVRLGPDPERGDRMTVVERGGQRAVTRYCVESDANGRQRVRLWPQTGRTHQLRLHLAHLGAPILGDRLYGPRPPEDQRLQLHAERLVLPATDEYFARSFVAPLPEGF